MCPTDGPRVDARGRELARVGAVSWDNQWFGDLAEEASRPLKKLMLRCPSRITTIQRSRNAGVPISRKLSQTTFVPRESSTAESANGRHGMLLLMRPSGRLRASRDR